MHLHKASESQLSCYTKFAWNSTYTKFVIYPIYNPPMEDHHNTAVGLIDSEDYTDPHFSALRTRLHGMLKSLGILCKRI